mgnify:CR=1 FL=1
MQWLADLTGQSIEAQARADINDLDRSSGIVKRQWYEHPWDWLFQRSAEDINKKAQEIRAKQLRESGDGETLQNMNLPGFDTNVTYKDSLATIRNRKEKAEKLSYARETALANDVPESLVNSTNSVGKLKSLEKEYNPLNVEAKADKKEAKSLLMYQIDQANKRYYDARQDRRDERRFQREQDRKQRKSELFQALFGLGSAFMI